MPSENPLEKAPEKMMLLFLTFPVLCCQLWGRTGLTAGLVYSHIQPMVPVNETDRALPAMIQGALAYTRHYNGLFNGNLLSKNKSYWPIELVVTYKGPGPSNAVQGAMAFGYGLAQGLNCALLTPSLSDIMMFGPQWASNNPCHKPWYIQIAKALWHNEANQQVPAPVDELSERNAVIIPLQSKKSLWPLNPLVEALGRWGQHQLTLTE